MINVLLFDELILFPPVITNLGGLGRVLAVCQQLVLGTLWTNDIVPVCDEALEH